ncbi:replication initiator protein RepSA [Planotetraspora phitsanulokensis]|uniref:Replication initiation protein n=1 Tax=Planotetraspora phitsanulokensis TaxID=575192 RepID=A0A8J3UC51_9ACTN|nr:replication initiator [Planotetraspora phitsanulokensis]GII40917.1 replication initiation protein [Planotetraspora phitsanulokensis]
MSAPAPLSELVGPVIRDLARRSGKDLSRWLEQVARLRGCTEPIRLTGESLTLDAATGEVLHRYSSEQEPQGHLMVRCGNRRASRCPSCAETYRADTFHLIRAGLLGGSKGVPQTVRTHPRVFATLTAPSFGPVHRGPDKHGTPQICHPRRTGPACYERHTTDDVRLGQPLDPATYDYVGHVLWNAYAGDLWRRFTIYLRRHLASASGLTQAAFNRQVKVSFAKVAEYQTRGVVHFHAIIRLDGRPDENQDEDATIPPPDWATLQLLDGAIRSAARVARLRAPDLGQPTRSLVWGDQVDVKTIAPGDLDDTTDPDGARLTEQKVAGYIAKYATKAAENAGTLDRRVRSYDLVRLHEKGVTDHAARLIRTAWKLGDPIAYPWLLPLRLRQWAHMLGFRGHFSTRSRAYSTTMTAIRQERTDYWHAHALENGWAPDPDTTLVLTHWSFAGQGYTPGESLLATDLTAQSAKEEMTHDECDSSRARPAE